MDGRAWRLMERRNNGYAVEESVSDGAGKKIEDKAGKKVLILL